MEEFNFNGGGLERITPARPTYKMIALRGLVVFPTQSVHFEVGRDKSLTAIEKANALGENIFLVAQRNASKQNPTSEDVYRVGVLARIQQVIKLPNDTMRVLVTGLEKRVIREFIAETPCFEVELDTYPDEPSDETQVRIMKDLVNQKIKEFASLDPKLPKEKLSALAVGNDVKRFIANATTILEQDSAERQRILELRTEHEQLEVIYAHLVSLCEILTAEKRIAERVKQSIDKNQKEYYLRE
ncbi:MAG: LON peptidase substrate-binding domain-containing protein, partial [Clostridia bacterium]|nr:LON peptidase substrate-binding domain-containing protein [Clostridia bacterium]